MEHTTGIPREYRRDGLCPDCGERPRVQLKHRIAGYCRECKNRRVRKKHSDMTPEQRWKANCRSYTNQLVRRGHLKKPSHCSCGNGPVQAHHPDYNDPRTVVWKCRDCHMIDHHEHAAHVRDGSPVPRRVPPPNGMLSVKQVAEYWDVHDRTVYAWCQRGLMPGAVRSGLTWHIPESSVAGWKPLPRGQRLSP